MFRDYSRYKDMLQKGMGSVNFLHGTWNSTKLDYALFEKYSDANPLVSLYHLVEIINEMDNSKKLYGNPNIGKLLYEFHKFILDELDVKLEYFEDWKDIQINSSIFRFLIEVNNNFIVQKDLCEKTKIHIRTLDNRVAEIKMSILADIRLYNTAEQRTFAQQFEFEKLIAHYSLVEYLSKALNDLIVFLGTKEDAEKLEEKLSNYFNSIKQFHYYPVLSFSNWMDEKSNELRLRSIIHEIGTLLLHSLSYERLFLEENLMEQLLANIPLNDLNAFLETKNELERTQFWFTIEGALRNIVYTLRKEQYEKIEHFIENSKFPVVSAYKLQALTTFERMTEITRELQFCSLNENKFYYLKQLVNSCNLECYTTK